VSNTDEITFRSKLQGRDGIVFNTLFDPGAFNCVDFNFVRSNKLEMIKMPWSMPVAYFDGKTRTTVNYGCIVPVEIGTYTANVPCLVTWTSPATPVVFGMQWFRSTYPEMVHELLKLGGGDDSSPSISEPLIAASATGNLYTVTDRSRLGMKHLEGKELLKHLIKHELDNQERQQKYFLALQARMAVTARLDKYSDEEMFYDLDTAPIRSMAASSTDVGSINGLTKNALNWREGIPLQFHLFCDTVFSDESAAKLPPHREGVDAQIHLKEGEKLWQCKLFDMPKDQLEVLKAYLDEQISKGFIQPSNAPVASPVFFVTDKASSSRGVSQLRLVVDYRILNSKIHLDEYPLPLSREIIDRLGRAKVYTKFDVRAGFNNIRIKEGHEWKTAFKTMFGLYEYRVMPMGLATAPSIFQRFINSVLAPFLGLFCFAYLDDIIIFSESLEEHDKHVLKVLEALEKAELHLKPAKCVWNTTKVDFLGFTAVASKGVKMSDDKIQAIRDWEKPKTIRDCRAFAGLANFYGKFIPHFSDLMKPIYELTKKGVTFEWTPRHQLAFDTVKSAMKTDVFLQGFDYSKDAVLETDSSNVAYAGVISQKDDNGDLRPVLMFSHTFTDEQKNWPAHDKELYAIVFGFDRYRHFLQTRSNPVEVYSDHRALSHFMTTTDLSRKDRHRRWADLLSQFNFQIQYRPGSDNTVPDALSRYNLGEGNFENLPLLPSWRFSTKALKSLDLVDPVPPHTATPGNQSEADTCKYGLLATPAVSAKLGTARPYVSPYVSDSEED
jgi:hypothetical protein